MLVKTIQKAIESYNNIRWFAYINRSPIIIQLEAAVQDLSAEVKLSDLQLYSLAATISAPEVASHHATKFVIEHSLLGPLDEAMPGLYRLCTLAHKHGYLHELTTMATEGSLRELCDQLAPLSLPPSLSYNLIQIWTHLPLEHRTQSQLDWLSRLHACQLDNAVLLINKTPDISPLKADEILNFTSPESLNSSTGAFEISAMKTETLARILSAFSKLAPTLRHFANFKLLCKHNVAALSLSHSAINSQSDLNLILKHASELATCVSPGDDLVSKATALEAATLKDKQVEDLRDALSQALRSAGLERSSHTAHFLTEMIQSDERSREVGNWKEAVKDRHYAIAHLSPERTLGALCKTGAIKHEEYDEFKAKVIEALNDIYSLSSLSVYKNRFRAVLSALYTEPYYQHPPFSAEAVGYYSAYVSPSTGAASALLMGAAAMSSRSPTYDTLGLSR